MGFILARLSCFLFHKPINAIHHVNKLKEKHYRIIFINKYRKTLDKSSQQTRNIVELPQSIKGHLQKPTGNIKLNSERSGKRLCALTAVTKTTHSYHLYYTL